MSFLLNILIQRVRIVVKCLFIVGLVSACGGSGSFGVSDDGETVFIDLGS